MCKKFRLTIFFFFLIMLFDCSNLALFLQWNVLEIIIK